MSRIYYPAQLQVDQIVVLNSTTTHRLLHVLRLKTEDKFFLFNNTGHEFQAIITTIKKNHCEVLIEKTTPKNHESPLNLHLGQVLARGEKMDYIIQKATELGASSITPLFSEHCNVQLEGKRLINRLEHWRLTAIAACEQCGRCVLPRVMEAQTLTAWLMLKRPGLCIVLDHCATQRLTSQTFTNEIFLLVGPEGGFSDDELTIAQKHGFIATKLGPRILRTETAALAAISALQALTGDF